LPAASAGRILARSFQEENVLRQTLALGLAASLLWAPIVAGQAVTSDPEVLRGIRQVEDGDYDPAIVTLDAVARRLAGDPARTRDLSQAYLYLGIAYIGKGHEAAAKAKFREAVAQIKDLTLSPDKFPPKVIDLFEAAREEARVQAQSAAPAPTTTLPAAAAAPPSKKGGGGKTILIIAGLAAAGGGVALAAGGKGGSSGTSTTPTTPAATPAPTASSTLERTDAVPNGELRGFVVTASKAGTLQAKVQWHNRDVKLDLGCQESNAPYTGCNGTYVRINDTEATFSTPVQQKEYLVTVSNYSGLPGAEAFTVLIQYP
jgi:hypothetical protein